LTFVKGGRRAAWHSLRQASTDEAVMNHRHRKVLHAIFEHPVSSNIAFRDLEHVFTELGAEVDNKSGNRIGVALKGHSLALHHASHALAVDDVVKVRHFLEACGVTPADYPA
jgi:hypothetical protein